MKIMHINTSIWCYIFVLFVFICNSIHLQKNIQSWGQTSLNLVETMQTDNCSMYIVMYNETKFVF